MRCRLTQPDASMAFMEVTRDGADGRAPATNAELAAAVFVLGWREA